VTIVVRPSKKGTVTNTASVAAVERRPRHEQQHGERDDDGQS